MYKTITLWIEGKGKKMETSSGGIERDRYPWLKIDDGMGGRQIIAGIARHVSPEELKGKQVVFVANLKPRKMMDEFSHGMVLAAVDGEKLTLLYPGSEVAPGTKVS